MGYVSRHALVDLKRRPIEHSTVTCVLKFQAFSRHGPVDLKRHPIEHTTVTCVLKFQEFFCMHAPVACLLLAVIQGYEALHAWNL